MADSTSSIAKVLARCSFCGKDNTGVKKLIAGPGVYICDECVALCDDILAASASAEEAEAVRATIEQWSATEILEVLPAVARNADSVESDLGRLVARLRAAGILWPVIAARLGLEPSVAQSRFDPS